MLTNVFGEINNNPDRLSAALIIQKGNVHVERDYRALIFDYRGYFSHLSVVEQNGYTKIDNVGLNLRVPYDCLTFDISYISINEKTVLKEIPNILYGIDEERYGYDTSVCVRYYFN
jgi:hypothetical protein